MEATRPSKRRSKRSAAAKAAAAKEKQEAQEPVVEEPVMEEERFDEEPLDEVEPVKPVTRDGAPILTASSPDRASAVSGQGMAPGGRRKMHERVVLESAPTARDAAFGGPPRYDWIDIETAAAIKVQSVARRNQVMSEMDAQGMSTSAIRNRNRQRRAKRGMGSSGDSPGIFQCCGMGLLFGETTEEDMEDAKQYERNQYIEKKRAKEEREAALRQYRPRNKSGQAVTETFEVVE